MNASHNQQITIKNGLGRIRIKYILVGIVVGGLIVAGIMFFLQYFTFGSVQLYLRQTISDEDYTVEYGLTDSKIITVRITDQLSLFYNNNRSNGISCATSDSSVLSVQSDGTIKAEGNGKADLTVSVKGETMVLHFIVEPVGWYKVGSDTYYIRENGQRVTGWFKLDNKYYYFDADGKMKNHWTMIDNDWYYFRDGVMCENGWEPIGDKNYYFKNGVMQTGWLVIDGDRYYLNERVDDESGYRVSGTKEIDSIVYKFDENGKCLNYAQ